MELLAINWLAVPVAVVITIISGSLWYSPGTLFMPWWKVVGNGKEKPGEQNMVMVFGLTMVSSAVQAAGFAIVLKVVEKAFGGLDLTLALITALCLWFVVIAPTYLVNKLFAGHGFKVWLIEIGNHLLNFLLFALLFGLWR